MIENLLTKTCKIKNVSSKNTGSFVLLTDEIESFEIVKCMIYGSSSLTREFPKQEMQNYDLNLILKGDINVEIKQIIEFNEQNYKVENIKQYVPFSNHVIKPYKVLNLIKLLK